MRRAGPVALALAAALAVSAGCRTPVPALSPVPAQDPRVTAALTRHRVQAGERRALRARARVSVSGSSSGFSHQLLLAELPARLRLEVIGLLGQRVLVLATDGVAFDLYRAATGRIERGPVTPGVLAEATGVPLRPEEATELLLAAPELPPGPPSWAGLGEDGAVAVSWPGLALRLEARGELREVAVGDGAAGLRARYDDWGPVEGGAFPHALLLEVGGGASRVEIDLSDVELNPDLPAALFRLPGPAPRVSSAPGGER